MLNKTDVRNAVNHWLKEARPKKDEQFSVYQDEGCIMIHLVNPAGEWREDRQKKT
ncbi:MAG: hypothetical protein PHW62_00780 [Candidatus Ratteibacteria bacterium]|nr:hypothetical protein [Candidatus Ratteibacteria bacterium]